MTKQAEGYPFAERFRPSSNAMVAELGVRLADCVGGLGTRFEREYAIKLAATSLSYLLRLDAEARKGGEA